MDKATFLYILFFVNHVIMGYTINKVYQREDYRKNKKLTFLYITIIVPILGHFLMLLDSPKPKS